MNSRLTILSVSILSAILVTVSAPALADMTNHLSITPAQRIARIQSRIGHLEHRESILRSRGKTQRLGKMEARVGKLRTRINKIEERETK